MYLERLLVDQAVNQDEPLPVLYVQISHRGELFRPRRVQDLQDGGGRVHFDLLSVKVLDSRVVLLDEGAGDKLDGERGFADAATAQHDHFVFLHWGGRSRLNLAANDVAMLLYLLQKHLSGLQKQLTSELQQLVDIKQLLLVHTDPRPPFILAAFLVLSC